MPDSPAIGKGCRIFAEPQLTLDYNAKHAVNRLVRCRNLIEVSGDINGNTLWDADTVLVIGDINILQDAVLNISPGTVVQFAGYYKINVAGSILATGDPQDRIYFTSQDTTGYQFDESIRSAWNGIRFSYTDSRQDSSLFTYCIFEYSKAVGDSTQAGGAVSFNNFSKVRIENCAIRYCVADRGGAIACRTLSNPLIVNNLIHDNYCLFTGSVIYNEYSYPRLINNTITSNFSINHDPWTPSCAMSNFFSKPLLMNNIIYENATEYFLGGQIFEPRPYLYTANAIYQDLSSGNIMIDPLLEHDFLLNQNSECIDAGALPVEHQLPVFDIMGNSRISGEAVDIGCCEYQQTGSKEDLLAAPDMLLYPNPFNPDISIKFFMEESSTAELAVYNIKGELVYKEVFDNLSCGWHHTQWNGSISSSQKAASGVYLFKVNTSSESIFSKAVMLK